MLSRLVITFLPRRACIFPEHVSSRLFVFLNIREVALCRKHLYIPAALCWEPLWEIPPMTRSWRKYLTGKAVQDPIHDEVMRKKPDTQGCSAYKGTSRLASASTPPCILPPFLLLFLFAMLQILVLPAESSPAPLSLNKDQLKMLINKSPKCWYPMKGPGMKEMLQF